MGGSIRTAAAAVALGALAGVGAADAEVRWRGEDHAVDALPAELPEAAREAVATWSGWAEERGYRLDLDANGRVLLIGPERRRDRRRQMELVARTCERFDALVPAPDRSAAPPAPPGEGPPAPGAPPLPEDPDDGPLPEDPDDGPLPEDPEDGPLPEDPDGGPPSFGDEPGTGYTSWTSAWGTETVELDHETIVFFVLDGERHLVQLLDRLAELRPYLADWAAGAGRFTGFTLTAPLAGAYVAGASGQEEWNPENELVHRLAELLLLRRFGYAPYWLTQGFAWHLEEELCGAIYCYPYRDEFVYATEHTAWPGELRREFEDHDGEVFIEELAFPRGEYDGARARRAFGAARFLAEHREGKLGAVLEALRLHRDADNRQDRGEGRWERDRFYEVPLDVQTRLFREQAGADVFAEMARYFRLGERYRSP